MNISHKLYSPNTFDFILSLVIGTVSLLGYKNFIMEMVPSFMWWIIMTIFVLYLTYLVTRKFSITLENNRLKIKLCNWISCSRTIFDDEIDEIQIEVDQIKFLNKKGGIVILDKGLAIEESKTKQIQVNIKVSNAKAERIFWIGTKYNVAEFYNSILRQLNENKYSSIHVIRE